MFDQLSTRFGRLISTPRGFHGFIGLYLAVTFVARTALFSGASIDDSEQLLYSQELAWGYGSGNPPLYTWLVIASHKIFGISIAATEAVKFLLLLLTYSLLFSSARRVLVDDLAAAVSAMSFLAIYFFAWEFVVNYSHTVILSAFCVALFYTLLRLEERDDLISYAILGAVLGFGLLSKYSFAIFAFALAVAALMDGRLRARLMDPRILIAVVIALLIALPHGLWMLSGAEGIDEILRGRLKIAEVQTSYGADLAKGLGQLAIALIEFPSPWLVLALVFFWRAFTPLAGGGDTARYRRLLAIQLGLVLIILLLPVLAFGASHYRTTYMFILILAPLYFFTRVRALPEIDKSLARFAVVLVMVGALVPIMLVVKFITEPENCRRCYFHIPYAEIAAELRKIGFERGTIITPFRPHAIGGNLRPYFPDSRIFTNFREYTPPRSQTAGPCLVLWEVTGRTRTLRRKRRLISRANTLFGTDIDPAIAARTITRSLVMSNTRRVRLAYILIPGGAGDCH